MQPGIGGGGGGSQEHEHEHEQVEQEQGAVSWYVNPANGQVYQMYAPAQTAAELCLPSEGGTSAHDVAALHPASSNQGPDGNQTAEHPQLPGQQHLPMGAGVPAGGGLLPGTMVGMMPPHLLAAPLSLGPTAGYIQPFSPPTHPDVQQQHLIMQMQMQMQLAQTPGPIGGQQLYDYGGYSAPMMMPPDSYSYHGGVPYLPAKKAGAAHLKASRKGAQGGGRQVWRSE